jgi:Tfp pilus assembly protein PilO
MKELTRSQKILAYAAGGIICVFLIEKFFFAGLRDKINTLNQQIKKEEVDLRIGIDIQKRKDSVLKDYNNYKDYLSRQNIPVKEIFTGFLKEIEKLAQESGLSIINLTPQNEPQKIKDYTKYNADLKAEAPLGKFFDFLNRIQNDKMLVKLDKLSLSPKDEQANLLKIEATISITIP